MLEHFIRYKGRGIWVLAMPMLCGVVMFILFDIMDWNPKYVRPLCFLIASVIIWFWDKGDDLVRYGTNTTKGENTLMWIDMKYWAIVLAIAGFISTLYI